MRVRCVGKVLQNNHDHGVGTRQTGSEVLKARQPTLAVYQGQSGSRIGSTRTTATASQGLADLLPFLGTCPPEASAGIAIPDVHPEDERVWVPQTDTVSFRPLCFNVSQGYYVNLLRVRKSGLLSRHRHPGPVHGFVLKGDWKYLEHEWTASQGSYIFEPPGETHTLVVLPGCEEMITLFHVTGALLYCDPEGEVVGYEDVFTKLEKAKEHYEAVGLGKDFVQQFVR
eukprot:CAMPEP_0198217592 /NCGR_PEP_ID=MMETSP1445-20131203/64790_1 /TAXON_ID=36898 /ORGANISM="Pyramimonas sp., Strain CCMP2087" /LENGTH=226 /DNA_ID=CAMNT_0043894335 /DNA_START=129 /DNA_END=809 /DNA_ORIENTATION=-